METKNIMIVGVGGQGSLLASKLLGHLLMEQGYEVVPTIFTSAVPNGEVDYDFYMGREAEPVRSSRRSFPEWQRSAR